MWTDRPELSQRLLHFPFTDPSRTSLADCRGEVSVGICKLIGWFYMLGGDICIRFSGHSSAGFM